MIRNSRNKIINVLLSFALILAIVTSLNIPSYAISFSDLDNHWAKSYIERVSDYKAISGYPDGSFKPEDHVKRIEFISIILKSQGLSVRDRTPGEYWGQPYIEAAIKSGLIRSNEYGIANEVNFEKYISREEMSSIVVNAYTRSGGTVDPAKFDSARSSLVDFDSVNRSYYDNSVASVALDFISGYPDGTFAPKQNATRAQAAIVSYRLLLKQNIIKDADLPVNIVLSKTKLQQGDLLRLTAYHVDKAFKISLVQSLYPDFVWYEDGDVLRGYIPTNYNTKPGVYSLKFNDEKTGNISTKYVEIFPRDFRVQYLKVDPNIESNTRTEEANAEYRKYFNPSRDISSPVKYYTEPFMLPVAGRVTTEFGETRTVNGAPTSYRHAGIDIAASLNSKILAANRGKVTLAMPLILTGNSIVIDHGEGLFSVYFHLEKLHVSQGEIVEKGQLIGTVGSTGFSTGPHLHFTMSYYRTNIEPGFIIYGKSITKANYQELMK